MFDIAGAPNRLIGALILTIVDHIEYAIHQTRSRYVRGEGADSGHFTGEAFLVIEEGWKVTESRAAGAWLNEYARRSRHWRLWLIFVTQLLKDLDNEQGRALMEKLKHPAAVQEQPARPRVRPRPARPHRHRHRRDHRPA